jgi:Uma2 family endonuclease
MSPSDTLATVQAKMREYIDNGACLGWLLNRKAKQVEIYRSSQAVEVLQAPATLSGEDVLVDFVLNLAPIW